MITLATKISMLFITHPQPIHNGFVEPLPRLHEVGEGFCGMRKCGPYNIDVGNADWLLKST